MKYLKVSLVLLVIGFVTGCEQKEYTLSEDTVTFEVKQESPTYPMHVEVSNGEKIDCEIVDSLVDYNTVGLYTASCEFDESPSEKNQFDISVTISDTTKPEVLQDDVLLVGTGHPDFWELEKHFSITDNYDTDLEVIFVEPEEQLDVDGTYELEVIVRDDSGNETSLKFDYVVFSYELPFISTDIDGVTYNKFNPRYLVEGTDIDEELSFEKTIISISHAGVVIETVEKTAMDYNHEVTDLLSGNEYVVEYYFYFIVKRTGENEVVNVQKTISTLDKSVPTASFTLDVVQDRLDVDIEFSDIHDTFITAFTKIYDGEMNFISEKEIDVLTDDITFEGLYFGEDFKFVISIEYDLSDGLGVQVENYEAVSFSTGFIFVDDIEVDNAGETKTVRINMLNPNDMNFLELYIDDEMVSFTVDEDVIVVEFHEDDLQEGSNVFNVSKVVLEDDQGNSSEVTFLNKSFEVIKQSDLVYEGYNINNGLVVANPNSNFNINIDLEYAHYYTIESIEVNGEVYDDSFFTIYEGDVILSYIAPATVGAFNLYIDRINYIDSELNSKYIDISESSMMYIKSASASIETIGSTNEFLSMTSSGVYRLTADIDLSGVDYKNYMLDFSGYLDGDGYSIFNMHIQPDMEVPTSFGLFHSLDDKAYVKNLTIENSNILIVPTYTNNYTVSVGMLVGSNLGGYIEGVNVRNSSITITDNYANFRVGGLVGTSFDGDVRFSCTDVEIVLDTEDDLSVGGLVGYFYNDASIHHSCSVGDIYTDYTDDRLNVGGLVGYLGDGSYLEASYSSSNIQSVGSSFMTAYVGGLVGVSGDNYFEAVYYDGELEYLNNSYDLNIGGIAGSMFGGTILEAYVKADIHLGLNPRIVKTGNVVGYSHNLVMDSIISEVTYYGTLDAVPTVAKIADTTGDYISIGTMSDVYHYNMDLSNIIGSDYQIQTSHSTQKDELVTSKEDLSKTLFFNDLWDYRFIELEGYPRILVISDFSSME